MGTIVYKAISRYLVVRFDDYETYCDSTTDN